MIKSGDYLCQLCLQGLLVDSFVAPGLWKSSFESAERIHTNNEILTQHTLGKYPIVSHGALLFGPIRHPEVVVAEQRFVAEQVGENVGNVHPGTLRLAVAQELDLKKSELVLKKI